MDKRMGYSFSWTQPYSVVSHNPFYQNLSVTLELQRLDDCDRAVQNMLTYPDAEAIINKLRHKGESQ